MPWKFHAFFTRLRGVFGLPRGPVLGSVETTFAKCEIAGCVLQNAARPGPSKPSARTDLHDPLRLRTPPPRTPDVIDLFPLVGPTLRLLPPEAAHRLTVLSLRAGLAPQAEAPDDPRLGTTLWGLRFANPVGLAAGFDKNAKAVDPLLAMGFGFVEVGGVTPRPQPGNPKPRVFRAPRQGAMINRLGLNNEGLDAIGTRLRRRLRDPGRSPGPVGVNLGPNRDSPDPARDFRTGILAMAGVADFLVINVSSPNTPGLRDLQTTRHLPRLLAQAAEAREEIGEPTPLLLKIAPDLAPEEPEAIAEAALAGGVDGLVVSNTTTARPPDLPPRLAARPGGLSGRPLMAPSTRLLAEMARLTDRRLPLIGVGGIAGAEDAYEKILAGASLVALYTALVYRGPRLVGDIKRGLVERLERDGFAGLGDAVGAGL
jgi:dihydroorotate dehydrogenase